MAINVKLSDSLVKDAKRYAAAERRSVPEQIEYWSRIGRIVAENPDLPYSMIQEITAADQEEAVEDYLFGPSLPTDDSGRM